MTAFPEEIDLLAGLLDQYSPSEAERPAVTYLVEQMVQRGFAAHVDEAGNAVGVIGNGEREILLLGHIDTVPGRIAVCRDGDTLFGRGAVDAKGPLSTFVAAATRAAAQVPAERLRIAVVGAVEEEAATSKGARHVLTQRRPDAVVIGEPSQWDCITLGYKGRLLLDFVYRQDLSHTAGQNAGVCETLVDYWLRVREYAADYNRDKTRLFETIDPSLRRVVSSSDGLAEQVDATIAFRLPLEADVDALKRYLTEAAPAGASITLYAEEVAFRADKNTALSRHFRTAIRENGGKPTFKVKTGTSDMNVVGPVWQCPIVAYGPGDSNLDHTPHEHIQLEEYGRAIAVLTSVLVALGSEGP